MMSGKTICRRYTHKKLQSEFDRVALNEEDWEGILNRARLRGLRGAGEGDRKQTVHFPRTSSGSLVARCSLLIFEGPHA
jgi:hypothetical protein